MFALVSALVIGAFEVVAVVGYMLVRRTRRFAQVRYVTVVHDRLVELYEAAEGCSPRQVDRAIKETGANTKYRQWAYALFCDEHRFHELPECRKFDYFITRTIMIALRRQIVPGEWYGGTVGFSPIAASALNSNNR